MYGVKPTDLATYAAAIDDALQLGTISFDAVKHLMLGRIEQRSPPLDLENYGWSPCWPAEGA